MDKPQNGNSIRVASLRDLKFLDHLQRKFNNSVGFLPKTAVEWNLDQGNVTIAEENGAPAGYLLIRPALAWQPALAPIFQACVAMDAQRRHHGLALLQRFESEAKARGSIAIQANCAIGVMANEFWAAAGFMPICHMTPRTVRNREIICWRKPLTRKLPIWFAMPPARHGHGAKLTIIQRNPTRRSRTHAIAQRYISTRFRTPETTQTETNLPGGTTQSQG